MLTGSKDCLPISVLNAEAVDPSRICATGPCPCREGTRSRTLTRTLNLTLAVPTGSINGYIRAFKEMEHLCGAQARQGKTRTAGEHLSSTRPQSHSVSAQVEPCVALRSLLSPRSLGPRLRTDVHHDEVRARLGRACAPDERRVGRLLTPLLASRSQSCTRKATPSRTATSVRRSQPHPSPHTAPICAAPSPTRPLAACHA